MKETHVTFRQMMLPIVLAATLPGIAAYLIVKYIVYPPVRYVVESSAPLRMTTTPVIVHRADGDTSHGTPASQSEAQQKTQAQVMRQNVERDTTRESTPIAQSHQKEPKQPDARETAPAASPSVVDEERTPVPPPPSGAHEKMPPAPPAPPGGIPPTFALVRLFVGVGGLVGEEATRITPAQAKSVLALMNPLREQEMLTPDDAAAIHARLESVLTPEQCSAAAQAVPDRPLAGLGAPGGRRGAMQSMPDAINPFNPSGDHPMAARMSERLTRIFDALETRAREE